MQVSISHRSELTKPQGLQDFIRDHKLYESLSEHMRVAASIEAKIVLAATAHFTVNHKKALKALRAVQAQTTIQRPTKHVSFGGLDDSAHDSAQKV